VSWGEERLREAHRTLTLMPAFPQAHWLAATVHVARHALPEAEREVLAGLAAMTAPVSKFSSVAMHWLHGLLLMARGDDDAALAAFEQELGLESSGHLYARECCANTWYAIGALKWRRGQMDGACDAFHQAVSRVPRHPSAHAGLIQLGAENVHTGPSMPSAQALSVDAAFAVATGFAFAKKDLEAARLVEDALAKAPPGNAGWLLPIEPVLRVSAQPDLWALAVATLRSRAA
jgi:hypothetical protein